MILTTSLSQLGIVLFVDNLLTMPCVIIRPHMRTDIKKFFLPYCLKYGFSLNHIPQKDTYFLHLNGRAIMTFNTEQFYSVPKASRSVQLRALTKTGLVKNLGEASVHEQLFMEKRMGRKIINARTLK